MAQNPKIPESDYSKGMLFDSVWEVAREYEEMPHFGNICQEIVLKDLKREIRFCRPDWSVVYRLMHVLLF